MSALKAHEVEAYLKKGARHGFILVYGPDTGLVNERCAALAKSKTNLDDPFALVRIEGDAVADDPAKLIDEACSISMFGAERVIWLRAGARAINDAVEIVFNSSAQSTLIVEAGDLKPSAPLRKLFEDHSQAITLPCYADEAKDLLRLIEEELSLAGLKIEADARHFLIENLGGDRLATRQELKKLCLYAYGKSNITLEDVLTISGDVSALSFDQIFDPLGLGQVDQVLCEAQRHLAQGTHGSVLLTLALRHMLSLQNLRYQIERGRTTTEAIKSASPPIFYKRQPILERQIVLWSLEKIDLALNALQNAVLKTRQMPHLTDVVCERALMDVAVLAKSR